MNRPGRLSLLLVVVALAAALTGCEKARELVLPNQLPTVQLTSAPIDTSGRYYYSVQLHWSGYDVDGRVAYFLYTQDPHLLKPGEDTTWVRTTAKEIRLQFRSDSVSQDGTSNIGVGFHIFLIKAVDDKDGIGPYAERAFFSFTTAPTVRILSPPITSLEARVTPSVRVSWTGTDVDGVFTEKPVKYKYILLGPGSEYDVETAIGNPEAFRDYTVNHPGGPFFGWDSLGGDTTQVQFSNLTPEQLYLFVVAAFDEAGAYSPVFSRDLNMLRMVVGFAQTLGPRISFFNEFFNYTYASGGYTADPSREVFVEFPADAPTRINWSARPPTGADIRSYRWAVDIENIYDETPRENELTDLKRWSTRSLNVTSVALGPYGGTEEHRLFVEAEDNNGLRSLGIVRFQAVKATFERALAVVDDTRLRPDALISAGCTDRPKQKWPTAAELDTFLYAVGNVPWGNPGCPYPEGTNTTPGIFAAYDFDTLTTKQGRGDPTMRLAVLGRYRHMIWLIDQSSASSNKPATDPTSPITSLRFMSGPGKFNSLGAYIRQGGKVWLVGGGGASATSLPWNDRDNDDPSGYKVWSSLTGKNNELGQGRFMFDIAHWRGEYAATRTSATIERRLGRFYHQPSHAYQQLPVTLDLKKAATDPLPPFRTSSDFYDNSIEIEFLQNEAGASGNIIIEDVNQNPENPNEQSVMDTLYRMRSSAFPDPSREPAEPRYVVMTYYHGFEINEFLFSGIPIWKLTRAHCQSLVDFVLTHIWHDSFLKTSAPVAQGAALPAAAIGPPTAPEERGRTLPRGAAARSTGRGFRSGTTRPWN